MNLNDLITITKILGDVSKSQVQDKALYIIGYGHIKSFLDCYFAHLALKNVDLSTVFNKKSKVSKALLKGKLKIDDYEDWEIANQPLGVVFEGKNKKGGKKKFLFRTYDVERYSNLYLSSILLRIENCKKNSNEDEA